MCEVHLESKFTLLLLRSCQLCYCWWQSVLPPFVPLGEVPKGWCAAQYNIVAMTILLRMGHTSSSFYTPSDLVCSSVGLFDIKWCGAVARFIGVLHALQDLPLLAFDSFQHMYVFPNFDDIQWVPSVLLLQVLCTLVAGTSVTAWLLICLLCSIPGRLQRFVDDLYTGKLHREYHHGPDVSVLCTSAAHAHACRERPRGRAGGWEGRWTHRVRIEEERKRTAHACALTC